MDKIFVKRGVEMKIVATGLSSGSLEIPISFIFWGFVIAYIIHIIDESLMGETFVGMVRSLFWQEYKWKHFFAFNTLLLLLTVISIILFEVFNGLWIIAPLIFVFLYTTNEIWHMVSTVITRKYSPGLASGVIYLILFYFLVRYSFIPNTIPTLFIIISAIVGTFLTILMICSFFIFKKRFNRI